MEKLIIKWKHWYWYCLLVFNVAIPALLALNRILVSKSLLESNTSNLVFVSVSSPLLATLLFVYVYKALKEANGCKSIIKVSRLKYFQWGILVSFLSFNLYVIASLMSYWNKSSTSTIIAIYVALGIGCILGTVSSICLTMYEFCVNFDIFYHKNKETIIKNYLEHTKNKIKDSKVVNEK